ncbi:hypothetical protein ZI51_003973 [Salmonella enterica subsp. enterica]|nr:hypothetical protein [Salmonella enterica subsp. enterica serovar Agbeni]EDV2687475.1 hypothetical protein [Salmonella enterica subsp. enterica serovar Agbeni]EDV5160706.1 hypothetical protein [Salmonella enterica subsp. enterica serovar Agbeni]EDV9111719.1 hypothetical protein [Salmonella enterica subsp. enterica]
MYGTVLPITWRMLCDQHGMRISLKIKIFIRDSGPGVIDLATHTSPQGLTFKYTAVITEKIDLSPPAGVNLRRHLAEIYSEK